ncbi:MAG: lysophospholipid acyltransferase family protein [Kiritimatiellia bacterium]
MKHFRYLLEYCLARLLILLIDILPLKAASGAAEKLAGFCFIVLASRRRIAVNNLLMSRVASGKEEAVKIARGSFRHLAVLLVETLKCGKVLNQDSWRDHVKLEIPQETMDILEDNSRSLIIASGHVGSWENGVRLLSFFKPVTGIIRRLNNPYVNRIMEKRRPDKRFRAVAKHDISPSSLLSALRSGNILAIMIDQHARTHGEMIDYFGTKASTPVAPALLHVKTGVPLCFAYCLRTGPGKYTVNIGPPLSVSGESSRKEQIRELLEKLTSRLESAIRRAPEQYLWSHRRWREPYCAPPPEKVESKVL